MNYFSLIWMVLGCLFTSYGKVDTGIFFALVAIWTKLTEYKK